MQVFYTDVSKLFECDIDLSGAPIVDASARLIFSVGGKEFVFNGVINGVGHCTFTIPALGSYNIIGSGTMNLEILVDNVFFEPFNDTIVIQQSDGADFDSFIATTNYDSVNNIDVNFTWLSKKVYDESPYLVLPGLKFNIKLGDNRPDLKFFVFKRGEQFGDPIPLPNMSGYTVKIKVYDFNDTLICYGTAISKDQNSGQITYRFDPLDFSVAGVYYFEAEFISSGNSFTLPETSIKYEIIVRG